MKSAANAALVSVCEVACFVHVIPPSRAGAPEHGAKSVWMFLAILDHTEVFMHLRGVDTYGLTTKGADSRHATNQYLVAHLRPSVLVQRTSLDIENYSRVHGSLEGLVLAAADGLEDRLADSQASEIALENLLRELLDRMPTAERDTEERVKETLTEVPERAQNAILEQREARHGKATMTMAFVAWPKLYVAHVGDTKCYLLRGDRLTRITRDHSYEQALDPGKPEARPRRLAFHWSRLLWNSMGGDESVLEVDFHKEDLEGVDAILVCTEGLSSTLSEEMMCAALRGSRSAQQACRSLLDQARSLGAPDDVTAVVADFRSVGENAKRFHEETLELRARDGSNAGEGGVDEVRLLEQAVEDAAYRRLDAAPPEAPHIKAPAS